MKIYDFELVYGTLKCFVCFIVYLSFVSCILPYFLCIQSHAALYVQTIMVRKLLDTIVTKVLEFYVAHLVIVQRFHKKKKHKDYASYMLVDKFYMVYFYYNFTTYIVRIQNII